METSSNRDMEKYSVDFTGRALANFVNLANVTYTQLGTYSNSKKDGKIDIVASGHTISDMNDKNIMNAPVTTYTFTNKTIIDKSPVFQNNLGVKTSSILENVIKDTELEEEIKEGLLNKLKDIDSRKCLVIPVRIHSDFKLNCEINGQKKTKVAGKVKYIKWLTNKETFKLECKVSFEIDSVDGQKIVVLPITEYGRTFVPDKMEYWTDINKSSIELLNFTDMGLIKPVELTDGRQSLVVDGTYLYWLRGGTVTVIGEWDYAMNTLIISKDAQKSLNKSDILRVLKNNLTLLNGHKHLIIPYSLSGLNKINVKELGK